MCLNYYGFLVNYLKHMEFACNILIIPVGVLLYMLISSVYYILSIRVILLKQMEFVPIYRDSFHSRCFFSGTGKVSDLPV
jgi:hypothetical protein